MATFSHSKREGAGGGVFLLARSLRKKLFGLATINFCSMFGCLKAWNGCDFIWQLG